MSITEPGWVGTSNPLDEREAPVSDCCGAEIYDDTDICSECKEHCGEVWE